MSARRRIARSSKPRLVAVAPSTTTLFGKPVQIEDSPHARAKAILVDRIASDLVRQALNQAEAN